MKYKEQYIKLHKGAGRFAGFSLWPVVPDILNLVESGEVKSILDYGAGKGRVWTSGGLRTYVRRKGVEVKLYEPGLPEWSELLNKRFDLVVCTDVMEHVPEDEIDAVLNNINIRCSKYCLFTIDTRPASKVFPGTKDNVHVTIKSEDWWRDKVKNSIAAKSTIRFNT